MSPADPDTAAPSFKTSLPMASVVALALIVLAAVVWSLAAGTLATVAAVLAVGGLAVVFLLQVCWGCVSPAASWLGLAVAAGGLALHAAQPGPATQAVAAAGVALAAAVQIVALVTGGVTADNEGISQLRWRPWPQRQTIAWRDLRRVYFDSPLLASRGMDPSAASRVGPRSPRDAGDSPPLRMVLKSDSQTVRIGAFEHAVPADAQAWLLLTAQRTLAERYPAVSAEGPGPFFGWLQAEPNHLRVRGAAVFASAFAGPAALLARWTGRILLVAGAAAGLLVLTTAYSDIALGPERGDALLSTAAPYVATAALAAAAIAAVAWARWDLRMKDFDLTRVAELGWRRDAAVLTLRRRSMWLVGGRPKRYVSTWHTPNLLLLPGAIEGALNGCDPRPYLAWSGLPASAGAPQAATS